METDSFFCQFFKQLPETLFQLVGLPSATAKSYRFDSVELKKSLRVDGLFLPKRGSMPLYFVEVQFHRLESFYANLFAKVFVYLHENDPGQEWRAVAIFPSKRREPTHLVPYEDLLASRRVKRIYLDELVLPPDPPLGLGILRLVGAPEDETWPLAGSMIQKARTEISDPDHSVNVVELIEELMLRRFTNLTREEIRAMFKWNDIRGTRLWKEIREEGLEEGVEVGKKSEKQALAKKLQAEGMPIKKIAELLEVSQAEARRMAHAD